MKKTKDNTQTGKNSKNERIRACIDELKYLLSMTKHEHAMLVDLCEIAHPTCSESMRVALLESLAKDFEMLFGSYYNKVILRDLSIVSRLCICRAPRQEIVVDICRLCRLQ